MVKSFFKIILIIILLLILAAAAFIGYLTLNEYRPDAAEILTVTEGEIAEAEETAIESANQGMYDGNNPKAGYAFNILTWNIGYGALGDNADFFMDGGTSVQTADEDRVNSNISNIISQIKYQHPNIVLLQEVDVASDRSYRLDEVKRITSGLPEKSYTYGKNYSVPFVPYPIPPMGKMEAGLLTLSDYEITEASRVQLPIPYKWPLRMANLKRCLTIHRLPVEGSHNELVLINLHLEPYTDDSGKNEQVEFLKEVIENEIDNGNYVIAGGDFNHVFSSVDASKYPHIDDNWECSTIDEGDFDLSLQFVMDSDVPTCRLLDRPYAGANHDPDNFQYYMLDGFILSDNVKVLICETKDLGFQYSDHNPVFLRVILLK